MEHSDRNRECGRRSVRRLDDGNPGLEGQYLFFAARGGRHHHAAVNDSEDDQCGGLQHGDQQHRVLFRERFYAVIPGDQA